MVVKATQESLKRRLAPRSRVLFRPRARAADPPASIEAARKFEAERRVQDAEQAAAEREAKRQREAEREKWLAEVRGPREGDHPRSERR